MRIKFLLKFFVLLLILSLPGSVFFSCTMNDNVTGKEKDKDKDDESGDSNESEKLLKDLAPSLDDINAEVQGIEGVTVGNTTSYDNVPVDSGTKSISVTNNPDGSTAVAVNINGKIETVEGVDENDNPVSLEITVNSVSIVTYHTDGSMTVNCTIDEILDASTSTRVFDFSISAGTKILAGNVTLKMDGVVQEVLEINEYMDSLDCGEGSEPEPQPQSLSDVINSALAKTGVEFTANVPPENLADGSETYNGAHFSVTITIDPVTADETWVYTFSSFDVFGDGKYILDAAPGEVLSSIVEVAAAKNTITGIVRVNGVNETINILNQ